MRFTLKNSPRGNFSRDCGEISAIETCEDINDVLLLANESTHFLIDCGASDGQQAKMTIDLRSLFHHFNGYSNQIRTLQHTHTDHRNEQSHSAMKRTIPPRVAGRILFAMAREDQRRNQPTIPPNNNIGISEEEEEEETRRDSHQQGMFNDLD